MNNVLKRILNVVGVIVIIVILTLDCWAGIQRVIQGNFLIPTHSPTVLLQAPMSADAYFIEVDSITNQVGKEYNYLRRLLKEKEDSPLPPVEDIWWNNIEACMSNLHALYAGVQEIIPPHAVAQGHNLFSAAAEHYSASLDYIAASLDSEYDGHTTLANTQWDQAINELETGLHLEVLAIEVWEEHLSPVGQNIDHP